MPPKKNNLTQIKHRAEDDTAMKKKARVEKDSDPKATTDLSQQMRRPTFTPSVDCGGTGVDKSDNVDGDDSTNDDVKLVKIIVPVTPTAPHDLDKDVDFQKFLKEGHYNEHEIDTNGYCGYVFLIFFFIDNIRTCSSPIYVHP
jgi:hypothetical protein